MTTFLSPTLLQPPIASPFGPITFYDGIPLGLQTGSAKNLVRCLQGPSFFYVPARTPTNNLRVVATFLRGTEQAGAYAMAKLFSGHMASRSAASLWANMLYFIGNPLAAKLGPMFSQSHLPLEGVDEGLWDMNNVWGDDVPAAVAMLRSALLAFIAQRNLELQALVEVQTGKNETGAPYAVVGNDNSPGARLAKCLDLERIHTHRQSLSAGIEAAFGVPCFAIHCGERPADAREGDLVDRQAWTVMDFIRSELLLYAGVHFLSLPDLAVAAG
ncbi:MAG: hypothetical protein COX62_03065 [Deltaproteobacteria bacterium CG_4_10_14_0_2_um_filter_43_8]|nr:MAG: hypothetical protein COV43_09160 [Deltaproteobacteria bacterium CG11_big_fil_rev_8_21_14_0_20_42_23]PJA21187.1 MAG: hypothetical protein COX62_03065 [Deltaproteobacteria bacterium CG_4_10_14_0_2_um_filter_43_8]PJC64797.1 MAG: hypothetical protein CO021_02435 [Deltaproteobacteria bacterium CG_4_9_14_0_2_um_filter_42_21]